MSEKELIMRKALAAGLISVSSIGLFGCGSNEVSAKPCEVVTTDGNVVHPSTYPLGVVAVRYQESRDMGNEEESAKAVISKSAGSYVLDIKGLPHHLANDYTEFAGTDAAVIIDTPQTGTLGLTSGCIQYKQIDGIPGALVQLPVSEHETN